MMTPVQDCACRALDREGLNRPPLVIVASAKDTSAVRALVGVSFDADVKTNGTTWRGPQRSVSVYRYADAPIAGPFDLEVCNGGQDLTESQQKAVSLWQDAASGG